MRPYWLVANVGGQKHVRNTCCLHMRHALHSVVQALPKLFLLACCFAHEARRSLLSKWDRAGAASSIDAAGRLPDGSRVALLRTNLAVAVCDDVQLTHEHSLLHGQSGRCWQIA